MAEKIIFEVKGSAEEPYTVSFIKKKNAIKAYCTCKAGENGLHCKHRMAIFAGNDAAIISKNKEDVATIKAWLKGTEIEAVLDEVSAAEDVYQTAKKHLSAAKRKLARLMVD